MTQAAAEQRVRAAYAERAGEYADLLGTLDATHPEDRELIAAWASALRGPAVDAGCGPGHWTDYTRRLGATITGIDPVPEFLTLARERFPDTSFRAGSLSELGAAEGELDGVLAWYSLIHAEPATVPELLRACASALAPGGTLLLGFFPGERREPFAHRVVTATRWPIAELAELVEGAGFRVEMRQHREEPAGRGHAAILARRLPG